ncbi:MAG: phosphate ABC transporter permease PstA [Planctomycetota bacterium]
MLWISGGALVLCLAMIIGLLLLVTVRGAETFWPRAILQVETRSGAVVLGEENKEDTFEPTPAQIAAKVPEADRAAVEASVKQAGGTSRRRMLRTGNFELTQEHFEWVSDFEIASESLPRWATVLERVNWGRFYGTPHAFEVDGKVVAKGPEASWKRFVDQHADAEDRRDTIYEIKDDGLGDLDRRQREYQKELRVVEIEEGKESNAYREAKAVFDGHVEDLAEERVPFEKRLLELTRENDRYQLVMKTADGREQRIRVADVVRGYQANAVGFFGRIGIYMSRWWEFLSEDPREANSEGGVFPAIFGTIVMTLLMVILVVPFGVLAALYLHEYAKQGALVSIVRIAVNNLAGVPSIVYGVFGLGFFCYIVGAQIDESFFAVDLADGNPTFGKGGLLWASMTLALLTLPVVIVATEEALAAVPRSMREGSYACGASKWQTIRRIVLPRAMPGVMTGAILALARGAGEVAPLMLVGAAKIAPELPLDGEFPFLHAQRSFMHLGFHIYDVGFQSQNSEAARPLVFTTTLLLIAIVVALNALAIWVRSRLRKKLHA